MRRTEVLDLDALRRGEYVISCGRIYALCRTCRQIVRINKPLLGGLHFCEP